ncbi:MAG: phosphate acyltransferase PlsX [Candidatus Marinimicrobia bacterium]|nr:phosphate acyltransferase PlsX [Candidatus Neomarinimicrobiota bacterium]
MRLALDAMGGDKAPAETVKGAYEFLQSTDSSISIILVGQEEPVSREMARHRFDPARISLVPATQVIGMEEKPAKIFKTRPDSSVVKAVQLVKDGKADGVISAGSTGAMLSASLMLLGRIPGVRRPAIGTFIPSESGGFLLCDVGANLDVRATDLVQFALMARAYAIHEMHLENPRIGLLNIGTEAGKGNEVTQRAYGLMQIHVNGFIGNVEANDLFAGVADVVVCDGFVGNMMLKLSEGLVVNLGKWIKANLKRHFFSMLALPLLQPAVKELRHALDWEEYGGAPLLGVNGVSIVCHGSSSSKAIKNALRAAMESINGNLIEGIESRIAKHLDINGEQHASRK